MLLDGIRVLDLSKVIAGPHCAMQLAGMGAEVIKVEIPGVGDDSRGMRAKAGRDDISGTFAACNAGKKSLTLDLKKPEALEIFKKLAATSDIIVENMRTGVTDRLGIGYEDIKKIKPDIIYCSVSGYGRVGPYRYKGGYDVLAQAALGHMSMTGPESGEPCRTGYSVVDVGTGMNAVTGILAALLHRQRTGEGQWVSVSLMHTTMNYACYFVTRYDVDHQITQPLGTKSATTPYPYQGFKVKDGWIILGMSSRKQWERFTADPLFAATMANNPEYETAQLRIQNRKKLAADIQAGIGNMTVKEAIAYIEKLDIPVAPINTMKEIFEDQYIFDTTLERIPQPEYTDIIVPKLPYTFSNPDMILEKRGHAPFLGENTEEVLHNIGYQDADIQEFRDKKLI